jgi:hypothetical protein
MSGCARQWLCCLAAVVLAAASGWRVAEVGVSAAVTTPVTSVSGLPDIARDATRLDDRRVVAEPAAAKRVELERLVAVAVAAAAVVLMVLAGGRAPAEHRPRGLVDRSLLRSRSPPLSFVSRP